MFDHTIKSKPQRNKTIIFRLSNYYLSFKKLSSFVPSNIDRSVSIIIDTYNTLWKCNISYSDDKINYNCGKDKDNESI